MSWIIFSAVAAEWTTAAGTFTLALFAFIALGQLRELKRDRHVHMLIELGHRWDSDDIQSAREKFLKLHSARVTELCRTREDVKATDNDRDQARSELLPLLRVPNYFEDLAVIVQESEADIALVGRLFKALILEEWDLWMLPINALRQGDPYSYTQWQKLVLTMKDLPDE